MGLLRKTLLAMWGEWLQFPLARTRISTPRSHLSLFFQVTSWRIKDSNEVFFENEQLCFFDALESQKVVLKTPLGEMKDVIMEEQLQTSAEK
jgi:hypothetical protein